MNNLLIHSYLILLILISGTMGESNFNNPGRKSMTLISNAFKDGEFIPSEYTCDSKNISPQLSWSDFPDKTVSFAIICDDPDAPAKIWVHWVIFNIPANIHELQKIIPHGNQIHDGIKQGINDSGKNGYSGPCPPSGIHRYYFKIYALDKMLDLGAGTTKEQLLKAIDGHILAHGQIMGRYQRK